MNVLNHVLRIWAQRREFNTAFTELARHTDRELRDMGINHSDIARIAYREAERRIVAPGTGSTPVTAGYSPHLAAAA